MHSPCSPTLEHKTAGPEQPGRDARCANLRRHNIAVRVEDRDRVTKFFQARLDDGAVADDDDRHFRRIEILASHSVDIVERDGVYLERKFRRACRRLGLF